MLEILGLFLLSVLLVGGSGLLLYLLVRSESSQTVTDRASAERRARRNSSERGGRTDALEDDTEPRNERSEPLS